MFSRSGFGRIGLPDLVVGPASFFDVETAEDGDGLAEVDALPFDVELAEDGDGLVEADALLLAFVAALGARLVPAARLARRLSSNFAAVSALAISLASLPLVPGVSVIGPSKVSRRCVGVAKSMPSVLNVGS